MLCSVYKTEIREHRDALKRVIFLILTVVLDFVCRNTYHKVTVVKSYIHYYAEVSRMRYLNNYIVLPAVLYKVIRCVLNLLGKVDKNCCDCDGRRTCVLIVIIFSCRVVNSIYHAQSLLVLIILILVDCACCKKRFDFIKETFLITVDRYLLRHILIEH